MTFSEAVTLLAVLVLSGSNIGADGPGTPRTVPDLEALSRIPPGNHNFT